MLRPHDRHDPYGEVRPGRDEGPQPVSDDDPFADRNQLVRWPEVEGTALLGRLAVSFGSGAPAMPEDPERSRVPVRVIRRGIRAGGLIVDEQPPLEARLRMIDA